MYVTHSIAEALHKLGISCVDDFAKISAYQLHSSESVIRRRATKSDRIHQMSTDINILSELDQLQYQVSTL